MVPTFISMSEVRKILVTGKSINFLREVCQDMTSSPEREFMLRTFENINGKYIRYSLVKGRLHFSSPKSR